MGSADASGEEVISPPQPRNKIKITNSLIQMGKLWRKQNQEKAKEYDKEYRARRSEKNKIKQREQTRKWIKTHVDRVKELKKKWNEKNPEYNKIYKKKYREKYPEKIKKYAYDYRQRHKEEFSFSNKGLAMRFEILRRDNFTCQYCGAKAPIVQLEVDHIFPKSKGGKTIFSNLRTACFDCNRGKRNKIII